MTVPNERQLLTLKEAAAYLAVSPRLVRGVAHDGRLRSVRFGRLLRFRAEDVEAFVLEHLRNGADNASDRGGAPNIAA